MITISLIWINVVISGFILVSESELWGMMVSLSRSLPLTERRVWMCIVLFSLPSSHFSHSDLHKMAYTLHLSWVLEHNACCFPDSYLLFMPVPCSSDFEIRNRRLPVLFQSLFYVLARKSKSKQNIGSSCSALHQTTSRVLFANIRFCHPTKEVPQLRFEVITLISFILPES